MTTAKNLAIWMDYSNAHLMEFTTVPITMSILHNRARQQPFEFLKKIGDVIKNYQNVLLFGPPNAKAELITMLKADNQFEKISLETKDSDKMSQNKQHEFVREHFSHR
jgi:hypothetical protein